MHFLIRPIGLLVFVSALAAQPAAAPACAMAKVDEVFARYNNTNTPGCAVGVSRGDKPVLESAYGMADLERGIALVPDSILEAGSVSKQFTAAAVLLLAEAGKLSLDDPVRKYIPELPDYGAPLTIRHMIHHTSGLRDWGSVAAIGGWPRTTRAYTHEHVLEILGRQRSLNYAPGAHYSYSNSGYNLAAILVSRVSGTPFATYTREAIFQPLGMRSTSWRDDHRRIVARRAVAYADRPLPVRTLMPFEDVHGNGGLLTTVGDLLRWNGNFAGRQMGGPGFVEAQQLRGRLTDGTEIDYAAGLRVGEFRGEAEVSHAGATAGYRAWLARYPKRGLSVAVLCNAASANAVQLGRDVAGIFLNGAAGESGKASDVKADPAAFAGRYRSRRDHTTMLLEAAGGDLRWRGQALRAVASNEFAMGEAVGETVLAFEVDGSAGPARFRMKGPDSGEIVFDRVAPWTPSRAELEAMAGEYRSDEAEVSLRVTVEDAGLVIFRRPGTRLRLTPRYQNGFENDELGSVRFLRNASGRIDEMSLGSARVWDLRLRPNSR
jgi:CubicO group peptidase (beta-lactamase class C family)